jgi:methylated-DNA-[protein]-cysteine S-methyltransferase
LGADDPGWANVDRWNPISEESAMEYVYKFVNSVVGRLKLVASGSNLSAVLWETDRPGRVRLGPMREEENHPTLLETERQLMAYFAGRRNTFEIELDLAGTVFQTKVWKALLTIPHGHTRSYTEIAARIGHPMAVRAVGAANARNPVSIIVPCHRVIGASGDLTGFAGGLAAKRALLALESAAHPAWRSRNEDCNPSRGAGSRNFVD